jgi:hypothetical protein
MASAPLTVVTLRFEAVIDARGCRRWRFGAMMTTFVSHATRET